MNIGIIGSGAIGGTLALKLSAAGHRITLANSRGADTIPERYLAPGVQAGDTRSLPQNLDVLILSVPPQALPQLVDVITGLPDDTILVDTSNYYPGLNGQINELNQGKTQAIWVAEQLGRPIIKTWNAVLAEVLQNPSGPLALPIVGDNPEHKQVVAELVSATGFTPVDAGALSEGWRQEPGSPAYCTSLTADELHQALAQAKQELRADRRDLAMQVIANRGQENPEQLNAAYFTAVNRLIFGGSY